MTLGALSPARAARSMRREAPDRQARLQAAVTPVVLGLGVLGLWLLTHPYQGIVHDARLYVGHVLARLDPGGVGQDIMFAKDGQFGFSAFPALLSVIIETFGTSLGAKLTGLAGLLLWVGAMAALAATMAQGRVRWVILVFVAVLPASYGGFEVFHYAEPMAVPRIFAEAFVLMAFALICRGRRLWVPLPLAAAALFNPIMALPGFGVWAWLMFFDPRERVFPLAVGCVLAGGAVVFLLLAATLHMPLVDRLLVGIDPTFHEVLLVRTVDLFPSAWPVESWSVLLVQTITVAIATLSVTGRVRSLLIAAIVVGIGGVAVCHLLGSVLGSLLAVQAQLWRSVWILAVLSAAALAICSVQQWRTGGSARLALGFLIIAWLGAENPTVGPLAGIVALVLAFWPRAQSLKFDPRLTLALWGFVALDALHYFGIRLYGLAKLLETRPENGERLLHLLSDLQIWSVPLCVLAVLWVFAKPTRRLPIPTAAIALLLVGLGAAFWDVRTPRKAEADRSDGDPALRALLATRPGEVLWLDGRFETWTFAGRPNWISTMQGAGIVFSRPLAMTWDERVRLLIDLELAENGVRAPFTVEGRTSNEEPTLTNVTAVKLARLCAAPDAPAWVIAPDAVVDESKVSSRRWRPIHWTAPGPKYAFAWDGSAITWTTRQTYVVIPCAS